MASVVYVNDGGTWKAMNFGVNKIHAKVAGVWEDMDVGSRKVYIKDAGAWMQAFPSDSITWTSYKTPTVADKESSGVPNLSTDPSYIYTNIITASDPVGWKDRASLQSGQRVHGSDFEWSDDIPGKGHGAITRVRVTLEGKYIDAPNPGNSIRTNVSFEGSTLGAASAAFTGAYAVLTFDSPLSGWGLTDEEAEAIYDATGYGWIAGLYDNASDSSDKESVIKGYQVGLQYQHN